MVRYELVGAAILTYNRPKVCYELVQQILSCLDVDFLVVVKDKDIDYGQFNVADISCSNYEFIQVEGQHNIAYNKNLGLKWLLSKGCQHIFMIEDDVIIKDTAVFAQYIGVAKEFKLGHLNWNILPEVKHNPVYTIVNSEYSLDIAFRLCGCFQYFSRDALMYCGLLDEVNYNNAFEHIDLTYRMSVQKFTTPFFAFADIHDSQKYLDNVGEGHSTLDHVSAQYRHDLSKSARSFAKIYGRPLTSISIPTPDQVCRFLKEQIAQ